MIYRDFGKTGVKVSSLGFGGMRYPEYQKDGKWYVDEEATIRLLRHGVELGVNYFDSAYYYCHQNSETVLGKALKPYREQVYISTKCPMGDNLKSAEDYNRFLDTSLKRLDTDYIDFYHFWSLDRKTFDEKVIGLGLIEAAMKAKEAGKIRHISFSFHDEPQVIKHIIDTAPQMESMLVQYNLLDRSNEEMIEYAAKKGLGVVVMGPVGGGRLAAPTNLYERLTGGKASLSTYELALRFVLGNPNVSVALSGMEGYEMVDQNAAVASLETPMTAGDWQKIAQSMEDLKKFSELYCTGCNYCQPCPKGINIPEIFKQYTLHNVYGLTDAAKRGFADYRDGDPKGALSADCIDCGACEKKCPQKLEIRSLLKKVESVLNV